MRVRLAAVALGAVFGFFLTWGRLTDPDVIRRMLLLQEAYLYLMLASAVAIGFVGVRVLRLLGARALVTGEPVGWERARTERRHVRGAVVFGLGWGIANSCPGPIAAQLATGLVWSVCTLGGVLIGVKLYLVRQRAGLRPSSFEPGGATRWRLRSPGRRSTAA